jgi:hypothetical protein
LLHADLAGWSLDRRGTRWAVAAPPDGPACTVEVREERRKLMRLVTTAVHVGGPATNATARLVLHHTGQLRRRGLTAKVRGDDPHGEAASLREQLLDDGELEAASLPLDFTSFEVAPVDGRWRATIELMGGSYVWMRLPPSGSYVRLTSDQGEALAATVEALHRRLPGQPPALDTAPQQATRSRHLPERGPRS